MEVTGPLHAPNLAPCPHTSDLTKARDDSCNPVHRQQQVDWTGWDCCKYFDPHEGWRNEVFRNDHVDPEKFDYNQYRYQMYAKPSYHQCHHGRQGQGQNSSGEYAPGYVAARTDVRALEQTTYIPVVPSNPGGEKEYNFPMTPRTMGQPDITSACCVPVIPSQPGYKNMTSGILPGPCTPLNGNRGYPTPNGVCPHCGDNPQYRSQCAPHTMAPPSNTPGGGFHSLPDTLPETRHLTGSSMCSYAGQRTQVPTLHAPNYTGALPSNAGYPNSGCPQNSGSGGKWQECVNSGLVKYDERVKRAILSNQETPEERTRRLKEVYGSFGSYLIPNPTNKRHCTGPRTSMHEQGNGFHFDHPRNPNRQCYVLERNSRC